MTVESIINKKQLTEEEMIFVAEKYILKKKSVKVDINLRKHMEQMPRMFASQYYHGQLQQLHNAYEWAKSHYLSQ